MLRAAAARLAGSRSASTARPRRPGWDPQRIGRGKPRKGSRSAGRPISISRFRRRRKLLLIPALFVVASATVLLAQTTAPGKVDVQWKCAAPNPVHALPVGDKADHAYVIQQVKCTAAKGEIGGVKNNEGSDTEFAAATGTNGKGHGPLRGNARQR